LKNFIGRKTYADFLRKKEKGAVCLQNTRSAAAYRRMRRPFSDGWNLAANYGCGSYINAAGSGAE
jgi:hypothetical protein